MTIDIYLHGLENSQYARCARARREIIGYFEPDDPNMPSQVRATVGLMKATLGGKLQGKVKVTRWNTYSGRQRWRWYCSRCLLRSPGQRDCDGYFSNYPSVSEFKKGMSEVAQYISRELREPDACTMQDYYFVKWGETPWMKLLEFLAVCRERPEPAGIPWDKIVGMYVRLLESTDVLTEVIPAAPGGNIASEEPFPIADIFLHHFVFRHDPISRKEIAWLIPVVATFIEAGDDYLGDARWEENVEPEMIEAVRLFKRIMGRYLTMLEIAYKAGLGIQMGG